jgi:hypothetical protein
MVTPTPVNDGPTGYVGTAVILHLGSPALDSANSSVGGHVGSRALDLPEHRLYEANRVPGYDPYGPVAEPALSRTLSAARCAFDLLSKASPEEPTFWPLPDFARHR